MRRAIGLAAVGLAAAGVGLILAGGVCAAAQDADPCTAFKWSIAREKTAMSAADLPSIATGQPYPALGQGVAVTLAPQTDVAYTVKPARPPKVDPAYGAELTLADAGPGGSIAVTLSDEAWVDVVQGGKVLRSTAFSGRAGCPGVRKSVRFTVEPGPLAIAISDAPTPTIRLDVTPVE